MTSNPCFDFFPLRLAFSSFEYTLKRSTDGEREREKGGSGGGRVGGKMRAPSGSGLSA